MLCGIPNSWVKTRQCSRSVAPVLNQLLHSSWLVLHTVFDTLSQLLSPLSPSCSLSFCLCLCLSLSLSVFLSLFFCLSLSVCLSVSVSLFLSVCLSPLFCLSLQLAVRAVEETPIQTNNAIHFSLLEVEDVSLIHSSMYHTSTNESDSASDPFSYPLHLHGILPFSPCLTLFPLCLLYNEGFLTHANICVYADCVLCFLFVAKRVIEARRTSLPGVWLELCFSTNC